RRYLPGVVPEPYAEATCLFTSTANEDFVIDEAEGVVLLSACSGHGGKFAPLMGELAAGLATGTGTVPEEFRVAHHRAEAAR
ncbi:sarcosine oxidase, partial [Fictibacillus arsenicus]